MKTTSATIVGDEDPDGDRQLVARDHAPAPLLRRHLRGVEGGGRRGEPDADAGDHAADGEDRGAVGYGLDHGAEDEEDAGGDEHLAAADPVGQDAGHEGSGQRAERDPRGDDLAGERANVEVVLDQLQLARDDALVVAEEQAGQERDRADGQHPEPHAAPLRPAAAAGAVPAVSSVANCTAPRHVG
jgi:hypothetical protein